MKLQFIIILSFGLSFCSKDNISQKQTINFKDSIIIEDSIPKQEFFNAIIVAKEIKECYCCDGYVIELKSNSCLCEILSQKKLIENLEISKGFPIFVKVNYHNSLDCENKVIIDSLIVL